MKTTLAVALALCACGCEYWSPKVSTMDVVSPKAGAPAAPAPVPAALPAVNKAPIEVCFVLDTTGSMSGLIEGAKQKVWSIANQIVKENPKRPLKMSLVPFRDRGDQYVTKVIDLTDDLDAIYKELMQFKADGGGDEPESVNQALADAVEKVSWTKYAKGQDETTRLLFLVGDSPPHMDYQDDVKYPETMKKAQTMNIIVNTIQCGERGTTTPPWKEIAKLGEGTYLSMSQTGSMVAVSTPADAKIVELNKELAKTVVPVGKPAVREEVSAKAAASTAMPTEAAAERASFYSRGDGSKVVGGKGDLVEAAMKDKEALKGVKKEELPANMQKMNAKEQADYVQAQVDRRNALNAELTKATRERDAYLKAQAATQPAAASFDQKVIETINDQANRKNR